MKAFFSVIFILLMLLYMIFTSAVIRHSAKGEIYSGVTAFIEDSAEQGFLSSADIVPILKRQGVRVRGTLTDTLNLQRIENIVSKHPYVKSAEVYNTLDNRVYIKVTQRHPVIRIFTGNNSFYLDEEGHRIPSSLNYTAFVPVVSGNYTLDKDSLLLVLASEIAQDDFAKSLTEQIVITSNGDFVIVPRISGHIIRIGDIDNFDKKMRNLKLFYRSVASTEGWDKYSEINLKFKNQVVCTKNQ